MQIEAILYCLGNDDKKNCLRTLSRDIMIFGDIFDTWLVESMNTEPTDTENQLSSPEILFHRGSDTTEKILNCVYSFCVCVLCVCVRGMRAPACACVCVGGCTCHGEHMKGRGQRMGFFSFLLPYESQRLNTGHQA